MLRPDAASPVPRHTQQRPLPRQPSQAALTMIPWRCATPASRRQGHPTWPSALSAASGWRSRCRAVG